MKSENILEAQKLKHSRLTKILQLVFVALLSIPAALLFGSQSAVINSMTIENRVQYSLLFGVIAFYWLLYMSNRLEIIENMIGYNEFAEDLTENNKKKLYKTAEDLLEQFDRFTEDERKKIVDAIDTLLASKPDFFSEEFKQNWRELKHNMYVPEAHKIRKKLYDELNQKSD